MEVGTLINPNSWCNGYIDLIVRWGVSKLMMSFLVILFEVIIVIKKAKNWELQNNLWGANSSTLTLNLELKSKDLIVATEKMKNLM